MTAMGKADHRLIAFAESLARLGFAALVPDLPGMRRFRPEEADISRIERAFSWMTRGGAGSYERCSLLAFSFAAGPALRAAASPAVREKVAAFIGVGAYYDLKNVLRHLTTSGGQNRPAFPGGLPIRHGKWLFLRYNTKLLGLDAHRDRVEAIVSRKRRDESAEVGDLLAGLPEGARAIIALMENKSPERFETLYARQGAAQRARLRSWGMRDVVPGAGGKKFFLHGRADPFIPASESILLASRARETTGDDGLGFRVRRPSPRGYRGGPLFTRADSGRRAFSGFHIRRPERDGGVMRGLRLRPVRMARRGSDVVVLGRVPLHN